MGQCQQYCQPSSTGVIFLLTISLACHHCSLIVTCIHASGRPAVVEKSKKECDGNRRGQPFALLFGSLRVRDASAPLLPTKQGTLRLGFVASGTASRL